MCYIINGFFLIFVFNNLINYYYTRENKRFIRFFSHNNNNIIYAYAYTYVAYRNIIVIPADEQMTSRYLYLS